MPRQPWMTGHIGFKHLRVPSHTQPEDEADCVVYSLWMTASYVGNDFPDRDVRNNVNVPKIDDIKNYISTDELGWRPNQADLTELSTFASGVVFSLESWSWEAPKRLITLAEERLEDNLPLIAFIDSQQLRQGTPRGSGPLHSIVIVGVSEEREEVAIADPWYAAIHTVEKDNLEDAWDPMLHQIIDVGVRQSSNSSSEVNQ